MLNSSCFFGFPEGIDRISNGFYKENTAIEELVLPDHIKTIGEYAFAMCPNLRSVNLNNVETIERYAFMGSSLEEITLPATISTFGDEVFSGCQNLTTATFSEGMEVIPQSIVKNCPSLTTINIPDSVTTIGNSAFEGCSSITSINFSSSITTIGEFAFKGTGILEATIPANAVNHARAFYDNESIKTITFEEGITTLKSGVLNGCTNLETINLPSTITDIETIVIGRCTSLKTINFAGTVEQWNAIKMGTSVTRSGRTVRTYYWNGQRTSPITGFTVNCSDGEVAY